MATGRCILGSPLAGGGRKEPLMSDETIGLVMFFVIFILGTALIFGIAKGLAKRVKKD